MTSFLRFRVSQPGHFKELRTPLWSGTGGQASPLPVPLAFGPAGQPFARGQGVPPHPVTP
jgi:hypothetical protein